MSSGFYSYSPPKPSFMEICQQNIDRLNKEKENIDKLYKETLEDIRSVQETISKAKSQILSYNYQQEESTIDGFVSMASTEIHSGNDLEELYFADIEVTTGKITVVAIDFSDQISPKNAINSTEYKKMALTSKIIKNLLSYCSTVETEKEVIDLINIINKMLDDKTVGYDFFADYIIERFNSLIKKDSKDKRISQEKWDLYCSLCTLVGIRPHRILLENIDKEIDELSAQVFQRKYIANARKALRETFEELGLLITDDYELEKISGSIIEDKDNPDYQLFLSNEDDSFAIEMIETKNSQKSHFHHQAICSKRKKIYELMAKKGYPLTIAAENDDSASKELVKEQRTKAESHLERIRRQRVINGRTGKARAIGV